MRRGFLDFREDPVRRLIPFERSELHSNSVEQVPVIDGLGEEFADAQIHGGRPSHHIVSGGEQNNRDRRGYLFKFLANLKSVHDGHHHIQDDKINGPALDDIEALVPARRTHYRQSMLGKQKN